MGSSLFIRYMHVCTHMLYKLPRKKLGDVVAIMQKLSFSGNHDNKLNVCQTLIHYESNN